MRNPLAALQARFDAWPDELLSVALLTVAAALVVIALQPGKPALKAITLGWVIAP